MRFRSTWFVAAFICLLALVILRSLTEDQKSEYTEEIPPSAIPGAPELTKESQEVVAPSNPAQKTATVVSSPYQNLSAEIIRKAQNKNEPWAENYSISDKWAIQLKDSDKLEQLENLLGGEWVESVAGLKDIFIFRVPGSEEESTASDIITALKSIPEVLWFEQEIEETFALRYEETPPPFSDPLLRDQWHLKNIGDRWNNAGEDANIYPAWNYGVSGAGIYIAVVDTGTQGNHPDLAPNYRDDLDFDYIDNDSSASPNQNDETHGTAVAGVAAAAVNDSCGVGAAFNADIVAVRMIDEDRGISSSRQASAVSHRSDLVHVYNNSWGPDTDEGARMAGPGDLSFSAIKNAVENGRNGLGAIYVWAAGNGRSIGSNVNYDGWASNRYAIAVGAVGDHGKRSNYSEPGAPMLICAHSNGDTSGIRTTD